MQRKNFGKMLCPVARTLERVGEWWSILILRDAFYGLTRFDQFQTSLGIAPNMLTRRLNALVEAGMLERRLYERHPPRYEYHLTQRGRDFWPVLVALASYGNRHFAIEGVAMRIADARTGRPADPVVIDRATGETIDRDRYKMAPGPAANAALHLRVAYADARRAKKDGVKEWASYVEVREADAKRRAARKRVRR
jgi:DNA-binding HxlR family transcriptional regulator